LITWTSLAFPVAARARKPARVVGGKFCEVVVTCRETDGVGREDDECVALSGTEGITGVDEESARGVAAALACDGGGFVRVPDDDCGATAWTIKLRMITPPIPVKILCLASAETTCLDVIRPISGCPVGRL
jgi:hypothetical protein